MYSNKSAVIRIEDDTLERDRDFQEFFTEYDVPEDNDVYIEYDSDVIDEKEEPYSYFLKKNGYDMLTNTIVVEGERVDAGEINFRETRDRLNSYLREHNFDQDTDTFVVESADGESSEVKVMSLDSIYPDEVLSDDMSLEEYYESYIKMGELIEESFQDYFQEDFKFVARRGLEKLVNFLKGILRFLLRTLGNMLKFIGGLFKKKAVSADQIMQDSGVSLTANTNVSPGKETVTGAPGSEIKNDTVDVILRDFEVLVNSDKSSVTFKIIDFGLGINMQVPGGVSNKDDSSVGHRYVFGKIEGHPRIGSPGSIETAFNLVSGETVDGLSFYDIMDQLKALVQETQQVYQNKGTGSDPGEWFLKNKERFSNMSSAIEKISNNNHNSKGKFGKINTFEFKYADIVKAQAKLNEVMPIVDKLRYIEAEKDMYSWVDDVTLYLNGAAMSMNKVAIDMSSLWVINGIYKRSCNNIGDAAKLTEGFIKKGVPSKFIRHNIMLILSKELNTSDPKMGQSRCVFFPKDDSIVYKFAMSSFGLQGNAAEIHITKELKRAGGTDIIAPVVRRWNDAVVAQVKCKPLGSIEMYDQYKVLDIVKTIEERLADLKKKNPFLNFNIVDLHGGNIGRDSNGKYVIIDYGWFTKYH